MSEMTVRQRAEAILLLPRPGGGKVPEWNDVARRVAKHAQAILDALDAAEKVRLSIDGQVHAPMRLVSDPDPGPPDDARPVWLTREQRDAVSEMYDCPAIVQKIMRQWDAAPARDDTEETWRRTSDSGDLLYRFRLVPDHDGADAK